MHRLGYETLYFDSIFDQDLYFAGPATRRADELTEMFGRDDVRAIICARGGYGCNYLLKEIDVETVRRHPKIFMGYSDVTTLLTWFSDAAGLVTFHGPMVTKDFANPGGVDLPSFQSLSDPADGYRRGFATSSGVYPLVEGNAEGTFYGGCLSMLVASLGTPYEIQTDGTILLVEDLNTKPFQIDRMLMHLKLAGKLDGVRGIIFGEMLDCVQTADQSYTLQEVILRIVSDLGIPVAYGLRSGHVTRENFTFPIGVRGTLKVDNTIREPVQLAFEAAVSAAPAGIKAAKR